MTKTPEKYLAQKRERYARLREEMRAQKRANYQQHAEKRREARRRRYAENLDEERRRNREAAERRRRAAGAKPMLELQAERQRTADERNAQRIVARLERERVRTERLVETVSIPTEVRDAWKQSHRNSALQRKYPTYEALKAGATRGDFS